MPDKLESKLVRLVMPGATAKEIEEATRRWFDFLAAVDRIAQRLEDDAPGDSNAIPLRGIVHE